jgi:hypothetical protein
MLKVQKNDKAFKELDAYATEQNLPLKELLLSDIHLDAVTKIFYAHMPKTVRMVMKYDKFKVFYQTHRENFVAQMTL